MWLWPFGFRAGKRPDSEDGGSQTAQRRLPGPAQSRGLGEAAGFAGFPSSHPEITRSERNLGLGDVLECMSHAVAAPEGAVTADVLAQVSR